MGSTISDKNQPKVYIAQRRIRVGVNRKNEELTMACYAREAKKAQGQEKGKDSFISQTYKGLSQDSCNQKEITKWDPRYAAYQNQKKRITAIKSDWLKFFKEFDKYDPSGKKDGTPSKKDGTPAKKGDTPSKRAKTSHDDPIIKAFLEGELMTNKHLERIAKDLAVIFRLKNAPPVVSSLDADLQTVALTSLSLSFNRWAAIELNGVMVRISLTSLPS